MVLSGFRGAASVVASRSDEISLKELSAEERKMFEQSDAIEWDAILKTRAVRVLREKRLRKFVAAIQRGF